MKINVKKIVEFIKDKNNRELIVIVFGFIIVAFVVISARIGRSGDNKPEPTVTPTPAGEVNLINNYYCQYEIINNNEKIIYLGQHNNKNSMFKLVTKNRNDDYIKLDNLLFKKEQNSYQEQENNDLPFYDYITAFSDIEKVKASQNSGLLITKENNTAIFSIEGKEVLKKYLNLPYNEEIELPKVKLQITVDNKEIIHYQWDVKDLITFYNIIYKTKIETYSFSFSFYNKNLVPEISL